jgi:hypothetical protein
MLKFIGLRNTLVASHLALQRVYFSSMMRGQVTPLRHNEAALGMLKPTGTCQYGAGEFEPTFSSELY